MEPETITDRIRRRLIKELATREILKDEGEFQFTVEYVEDPGPFNINGVRVKVFVDLMTSTSLGLMTLVNIPATGDKITHLEFSVFVAPEKYESTMTDLIRCPVKSPHDYIKIVERIIDVIDERMRVMGMGDYVWEEK